MLDDFGRGYLKALKDHNMKDDCSLGCCDMPRKGICTKSKKEKKMNRVNIEDISVNIEAKAQATDESQRQHLQYRLEDEATKKFASLRKQFYLDDDDRPSTPKELVDRILAGKYILPSEEEAKKMQYWGHSIFSQITWRDPALKADQAGYDKAFDALMALKTDASDDIRVQSPADGLVTLRKFRDTQVTA